MSFGFGCVAAGDITQRRFIKPSAVGTFVMATAGTSSRGDPVYGISGEGTRNAPYSTLDDGLLAISGESFKAYRPGQVCMLTAGGNVAVGARLKSDSTGRGVTATADGDQYGAVALSAGAANQYILVRVEIGVLSVPA